jgi:hypothetical protein
MADQLREMKAKGVVLDDDGCQADDYAHLLTHDEAVANLLNLDPVAPEDEEDGENEDESVSDPESGAVTQA